jgi:hypothetical protein
LIAATIRLAVPHAHEMTACRMLAAFFTLSSIGMVSIRSDGNKFFQSEVANPCSSKADARTVLRPPVASPRTAGADGMKTGFTVCCVEQESRPGMDLRCERKRND